MPKVIAFLETMGQDATLAHAERELLATALADAQVDPAQRAAILDLNQGKLETLLGARATVFCGLFPAKKDDDEKQDEEDKPSKEDEEISLHRSTHCVA